VNINKVILTGRLTRDPELRALPDGKSVCGIRLANDAMGRKGDAGFVDVTVYGAQADACGKWLSKGSKVAVDGRLEWHEWDGDDGVRRQSHCVVANTVEFLSRRAEQDAIEPEPIAA
jgi:single-strand DNA-binding protein